MKVLLALLLALPVAAEDASPDWSAPIQTRPPRPIELPAPQNGALSNGMRMSYTALRDSSLVSAILVLPHAGTGSDPVGMEGLASMLGSLVQQGLAPRDGRPAMDAAAFERKLTELRASMSVRSGPSATVVTLLTVKEYFGPALALVREALERPALAENDFERVKAQSLSAYEQQIADPQKKAEKRMTQRLFGPEDPRGRTLSPESLAAANLPAARELHARGYTPAGATLIVAGGLDSEEVKRAAEQALSGWTATAEQLAAQVRQLPRLPPPSERPAADAPGTIDLIDSPGAPQVYLHMGQIAPERSHPDYGAFVVLNTILGSGRSRINDNLREGRGRSDLPEGEIGLSWSYGGYSIYESGRGAGAHLVHASVALDYAAECVREVMHELRRIQDNPPSDEEVQRAVNNRSFVALLLARGPKSIAEQRLSGHQAGVEGDSLAQMLEAVKKVTPADVQRAAKTHLRPDAPAIVLVGDAEKVAPRLRAVLPDMPVRLFGPDGRPKGGI